MVYESVSRVPLIMDSPAGLVPVDGGVVRTIDIVPSVLSYLGLDVARFSFEGQPLLQAPGEAPVAELAFVRQGVRRAVSDGTFKLVYDAREDAYWLYDLVADPEELSDCKEDRSDDFRRLRKRLLQWLEQEGDTGREDAVKDAERLENQLRAVGYLG
jgi:arylsulfatase A-like enzyme